MIDYLFLGGALMFAGVVLYIGFLEMGYKHKVNDMPIDEAFVKACAIRCRCSHVSEADIKQTEIDFEDAIKEYKRTAAYDIYVLGNWPEEKKWVYKHPGD